MIPTPFTPEVRERMEKLYRGDPDGWRGSLADDLRSLLAAFDHVSEERDRLRETVREIVDECHNSGYPNDVVATRMIERIEEFATQTLKEQP